jgi:glycerate kinase
MRRVVVAPNAFKGSLTASEAAAAMCAGVAVVEPEATILARPLADGGDGSVESLLTAGYDPLDVTVTLPDGQVGAATIAVRGDEAVVELANTCGLVLTPEHLREPMTASTRGLADAVTGALDAGAQRIVMCVGGSGSTDGGVGLLCGLGGRVLDGRGQEARPGGRYLSSIAEVDLTGVDPRLSSVTLLVATDVTSPLFGPEGAAYVFAPQKGASADEVRNLDEGLRSWAHVVAKHNGHDMSATPGTGAAGGTAFAAAALLGATIIPGATFIANAIGLDAALDGADLLITGEGSLDAQSLLGKGAVGAAMRARALGVPTVLVCGRLDMSTAELRNLGVVAAGSLVDIAPPSEAIDNAAAVLVRRTIQVLAELAR